MIYLVYGKDWEGARKKLQELLDFFKTKIEERGIFRVESENFEAGKFEELMRGQTLFEKKYVVVSNKIFESSAAKLFVEKNIGKIAASQNIFLFIEEEMDKDLLALFKKHAQKVQEFKISQGRSLENYNPFAIGDALATKNKTKAWILLQEALLKGFDPEEIFYRIFWQVKALLLIKKNPGDTGLNPFVVRKNLYNADKFSEGELIDYSFNLLKIYHDCRRGLEEFSLGLEKFIINLSAHQDSDLGPSP